MNYPNYYYPQATPIQQTGFIRVPSEEVARNWNVMPGTSATFINENAPYCYTKTMGFSQFDGPKFKKYRLVEEQEEMAQAMQVPVVNEENSSNYITRQEFDEVKTRIELIERSMKNEPSNAD